MKNILNVINTLSKAVWALLVKIYNKLKTVNKKILIGVLCVALIIAAIITLVGHYFSFNVKLKTDATEVVIRNEAKPASVATDNVKVKLITKNTTKVEGKTQISGEANVEKKSLVNGDSVTVPVTGKTEITYVDKTGQTLGQGNQEVSGETKITVKNDQIQTNTTLTGTSKVQVVTQTEPKKRHELGYLYNGESIMYYKYDFISFKVWKVEASAFVGGEINVDDKDSKGYVGVRTRF